MYCYASFIMVVLSHVAFKNLVGGENLALVESEFWADFSVKLAGFQNLDPLDSTKSWLYSVNVVEFVNPAPMYNHIVTGQMNKGTDCKKMAQMSGNSFARLVK
jgi:hypothetical protein